MNWQIIENNFNKKNIINNGNKFLTGNLTLGVRGTLDEFTKSELVAVNLPLIYNQKNNESWRESVNAFNPLYTIVEIDGKEISLLTKEAKSHKQQLNMRDGRFIRETVFEIDNSLLLEIKSERFVSNNKERVIIGKYQVKTNRDVNLTIKTGIDLDIWDINGPHLNITTKNGDDGLVIKALTTEKKHEVAIKKTVNEKFKPLTKKVREINNKLIYEIEAFAIKEKPLEFEYITEVIINQGSNFSKFNDLSYQEELIVEQTIWAKRWHDADVIIEGDSDAQKALRFSIFQLLMLTPSKAQSIPARGISGQTYKGAVFWDTEIFMLPFYLNTNLTAAKSIIDYRIAGLAGALTKAKEYGFKGAFYAWESHENGLEVCTDYNVTNVFTNRKQRTYFRDKQIHISADIVYAIKEYIFRSNSNQILNDGAFQVTLEVARFYLSYSHYNLLDKKLEFWDVMGPDEYHERVHNNAFTNKMIKMVFDFLLSLEDSYNNFQIFIEKYNFTNELELVREYRNKIKIIVPNDQLLIEQFDGYFRQKDPALKNLLEEKQHDKEYLGGSGLAGDTQIIKQADVIAMLYLFKNKYDKKTMKANFDYYEPRTEHGSSLSASMYALVACLTDNPDYAYPLFIKSASVDLTGESKQYAGSIYIGGSHPAAAGGAYLTAIYGFAGLSIDENYRISLKPQMPDKIKSIEFKIKVLDKQYLIKVNEFEESIKEVFYE